MDLQQLFSKLEYAEKDSLILLSDKDWKDKVVFPSRVIRLLEDTEKWSPKAIFHFDNKPLILFFENPNNKADLHKAIWNFNETPIVFIIEDNELSIYNGFAIDKNTQLLKRLGGNEVLNDFSYFELVTGKTLEQYKSHFKYKHRVDYYLLKNIEATQEKLLKQYQCERKVANSLIGKVIFIRYLIDRKIKLSFDGEARVWGKEEFSELLLNKEQVFEFFTHLQSKDKGFNGDLFPISKTDFYNIPDEAFILIKKLLKGGDIKARQPSLFQLYDFSVLPIELISNVYERFIGKENQTKAGAYYTPTFLVDYIISQTVTKKLNSESSTASCKVLDPACGSGIFLVETLRKIIEKYIEETNADIKSEKFKSDIKEIVKENIFGVDKDLSAIQVAIFSIYLTLLDYLEPPAVESFKFPILLNSNFFEADFFDTTATYNDTFKDIEFDFILGNPPWMRGRGDKEKPFFDEYIQDRRKKEKNIDSPECTIGNREIAQAFLIRSSDFSKENTKCALIVTSKVLYNLQSADFRKYFLHNYHIKHVFELAPVRREVFDKSNNKAIAPACIMFFNYANGESTDTNIIEHIALKPSKFFSLFKVFSLNRTDYKEVQQSKLKEYDWLWKVLVYGSYLDFNFIRRLNEELDIVQNVIKKENILFKQGLKRKDGDKQINVAELKGKPFIDTQKKQLQPFMIIESGQKWENENVGYIYKTDDGTPFIDLFKPYSLLITEGVFSDLTSNAAINNQERVFTSSIRALKIQEDDKLNVLYDINVILCSSLFAYYALKLCSSIGIEREQTQDEEIVKMWYFKIPDIVAKAQKIEKYQTNKHILQNQAIKEISIRQQCDEIVIPSLSLTEEEKELLNYANEITIPIQMRHKGFNKLLLPCKNKDKTLNDYAQLFINRFQSNLSNEKQKFIVEILHTNQIIGMFFKLIPVSEYVNNIVWVDNKDISEILPFIVEVSSEKITDRLFVQKDVRGFEKDNFYIFKPNEKRLWHKAIGYLDVNEFADAILKAGREVK